MAQHVAADGVEGVVDGLPRRPTPSSVTRSPVRSPLTAEGLKTWHHVVLSAVHDLAPVAQADLGRGVRLDPKGRRKSAVSLADQGARLLKRCEKAAREADDTLFAPPAERDRFTDLLIRISGTQS
ncbi:hypothetical protein [Streptomyces sp. bgisy027]|uniref:hypothetical protein n=1 Tax=Streptomyces sp. bgisy027 TaxID=3413770 RepID=UPI003D74360E